jgi:hypothetical protein
MDDFPLQPEDDQLPQWTSDLLSIKSDIDNPKVQLIINDDEKSILIENDNYLPYKPEKWISIFTIIVPIFSFIFFVFGMQDWGGSLTPLQDKGILIAYGIQYFIFLLSSGMYGFMLYDCGTYVNIPEIATITGDILVLIIHCILIFGVSKNTKTTFGYVSAILLIPVYLVHLTVVSFVLYRKTH